MKDRIKGAVPIAILYTAVLLLAACARVSSASRTGEVTLPESIQLERAFECSSPERLWLVCRDVLRSLEATESDMPPRFYIHTRDLNRLSFVAYHQLPGNWRRHRRIRLELHILPPSQHTASPCLVRIRLVAEQRLRTLLSWYEWNETNSFKPSPELANRILDAIEQALKQQQPNSAAAAPAAEDKEP